MSRVVLTAPWKLGLFVFTLVLGCGFGLVYAYLSLFGGTLDFQDDASVRAFFMVCGGVALLALLGYLGVVTQARPLEKVVRGSSKRANLLKRFAEIEDPHGVDPHQFDDQPELVRVLERWRQDAGRASNAQTAVANQREAITSLAVKVQTASHSPDRSLSMESDELQPLVHAINQLIHDLRNDDFEGQGANEVDRATMGRSLTELRRHQSQLTGFAASVAASSEELSRRAQANLAGPSAGNGLGALRGGSVRALCERSAQRLVQLRTSLEELAEESNRLAINAALQVSRLGDSNLELMNVTEEIRSVSTRYHRLAGDLRVCENDLEMALAQFDSFVGEGGGHEGPAATGLSAESIQKIAMVLDQNAGGLQEIATQLDRGLASLAASAGVAAPAPAPTAPPAAPRTQAAPTPAPRPPQTAPPSARRPPQPAAPTGGFDLEPTPRPAHAAAPVAKSVEAVSAAFETVSSAAPHEKVYDLADLGGVEMAGDDPEEHIYDLSEFGAVEV